MEATQLSIRTQIALITFLTLISLNLFSQNCYPQIEQSLVFNEVSVNAKGEIQFIELLYQGNPFHPGDSENLNGIEIEVINSEFSSRQLLGSKYIVDSSCLSNLQPGTLILIYNNSVLLGDGINSDAIYLKFSDVCLNQSSTEVSEIKKKNELVGHSNLIQSNNILQLSLTGENPIQNLTLDFQNSISFTNGIADRANYRLNTTLTPGWSNNSSNAVLLEDLTETPLAMDCRAIANGIEISIEGGEPPYEIHRNRGFITKTYQNRFSLRDLEDGEYYLQVTDISLCTEFCNVEVISEPITNCQTPEDCATANCITVHPDIQPISVCEGECVSLSISIPAHCEELVQPCISWQSVGSDEEYQHGNTYEVCPDAIEFIEASITNNSGQVFFEHTFTIIPSLSSGEFEINANSNSLCDGPILFTLPDGYTLLNWTNQLGEVQNNNSLQINNPGEYTFNAISPSNCIATTSYLVDNYNMEPLDITASAESTCQGYPIELSAPSGYDSYSWYYRENNLLLGTSQTLSTDLPGEYTLIVEGNINDCQENIAIINIEAAANQDIQITQEGEFRCNGNVVTLVAQSEDYSDFTWTNEDGEVIGYGDQIEVNTEGIYRASSETYGYRCEVYDEIAVEGDLEQLDLSLDFYTENDCEESIVILQAFTTAQHVEWTWGDNQQKQGTSIVASISEPTVFTVFARDENGCEATEVIFVPYQNAQGEIVGGPIISSLECFPSSNMPSIHLKIEDYNPNYNYYWSTGEVNEQVIQIDFPSIVFVKIVDPITGCESIITKEVSFCDDAAEFPQIPEVVLSDDEICIGECVIAYVSNFLNPLTTNDFNVNYSLHTSPANGQDSWWEERHMLDYLGTGIDYWEICTSGIYEIGVKKPDGAWLWSDPFEITLNENCESPEECDNLEDDDNDGLVDCFDPDCNCLVEICSNGIDDDGDGYIDCEDNDCFAQIFESTLSICPNECVELIPDLTCLEGNEGYEFNWSPSSSFNNVSAPTQIICPSSLSEYYQVSVLDLETGQYNGFVFFFDAAPDLDVLILQPAAANICEGESVTVTVLNSYSGMTFEWYDDTNNLISTDPTIAVAQTGTYTVRGTIEGSCGYKGSIEIRPTVVSPIEFEATTINLCTADEATITAISGHETYEWFNEAGQLLSTTDKLTVSQAGIYTVEAIDPLGNYCDETAEFQIYDVDNSVQIEVFATEESICPGQLSFLTTEIGFYNRKWFDEDYNFISDDYPLSITQPGVYRVKATKGGCEYEGYIEILEDNETTQFVLHSSPSVVCKDGLAQLWVEHDLEEVFVSYEWSNGSKEKETFIAVQENQTVWVTLCEKFGCCRTKEILIEVGDADLDNEINVEYPETCDLAKITITNPLEIKEAIWSTGEVGESVEVKEPGTYYVTVTDASWCTEVEKIIIDEFGTPDGYEATIFGDLNLCYAEKSTLTVTTSGMMPPLTYNWSIGGDKDFIYVPHNPAGSYPYSVTVTDVNGCEVEASVIVQVSESKDSDGDGICDNVDPDPDDPNDPCAEHYEMKVCVGDCIDVSFSNCYDQNEFVIQWDHDGKDPYATVYCPTKNIFLNGKVIERATGNVEEEISVQILTSSDIEPITFTLSEAVDCPGHVLIETSFNYDSYEWYFGGSIVSTNSSAKAYETGDYELYAYSEYGCVTNNQIYVFVEPTPEVEIEVSSDVHCLDVDMQALIEGAYNTVTWENQNGEILSTTLDAIATSPGIYYLKVEDVYGCINLKSIIINAGPDLDQDGVCDEFDCDKENPFIGQGLPCSDGDPCTRNDKFDADCNCIGIEISNCVECQVSSNCDDNNPCTTDDVFDADCNCVGVDNPDCVLCQENGICDDGNPCTENDAFDEYCNCIGTPIDNCDENSCDSGTPCDDGDPCSINDRIDSNCNCTGDPIATISITKDLWGTCEDNIYDLSVGEEYDTYLWYRNDILVSEDRFITVSELGNYRVEVFTSSGCTNSDEIYLEDNVNPDEGIINADSDHLCTETESVKLSVSDHYTDVRWYDEDYQMILGDHQIEIKDAGTYHVELETELGCLVKGVKTISEGPFKAIVDPQNALLECDAGEKTLKLAELPEGADIAWYDPDGEIISNEESVVVKEAGEYSVTVKDPSGCSVSSDVQVKEPTTENIEEILLAEGFEKLELTLEDDPGLTGENSGARQSTGDCTIDKKFSEEHFVSKIGEEWLNETQSVLTYLEELIAPHCICDTGVEGLYMNNMCNEVEGDIQWFLDHIVRSEGESIQAYIVKDDPTDGKSYLFLRKNLQPDCANVNFLGLNVSKFESAFNEILCGINSGENISLSYSGFTTITGKQSLDLFSGKTLVFLDGKRYLGPYSGYGVHIGNYRSGEEILVNDANTSKTDTWCHKAFLGIQSIDGDFTEIEIPYAKSCLGKLKITVSNVDYPAFGNGEDLGALFNKEAINAFAENRIIQISNNVGASYADKFPHCLIPQGSLCTLFIKSFLDESSGIEKNIRRKNAKYFLSTQDAIQASAIIDCFNSNSLVQPYRYDLFDGYFHKVGFLGDLVRLYYLSGNQYGLYDEDDSNLRIERTNDELSSREYFDYDYPYGESSLSVAKYYNKPHSTSVGGMRRDPVPVFSKNYNYFDKYLVRFADEYNYLGFEYGEYGELADAKVPGIVIAYCLEKYDKTLTDQQIAVAVNLVSLMVGFGQLSAVIQAGRLASLSGAFAITEVVSPAAGLFLEANPFCNGIESIPEEFCNDLKSLILIVDLACLTNAFIPTGQAAAKYNKAKETWNGLGEVKQNKIVNDLNDATPGAKKGDNLKKMMTAASTDWLQWLKTNIPNVPATTWDDFWLAAGTNPILLQNVNKFYVLKADIIALGSDGQKFIEDLLSSTVPVNGLGRNLDILNAGHIEAWTVLKSTPHRVNINWVSQFERWLELDVSYSLSNDILHFTAPNGFKFARIENGDLIFNYGGFGGDIVVKPNKVTTVLGKFQEIFGDDNSFGTWVYLQKNGGLPDGVISRVTNNAPPNNTIAFLDLPADQYNILINSYIKNQISMSSLFDGNLLNLNLIDGLDPWGAEITNVIQTQILPNATSVDVADILGIGRTNGNQAFWDSYNLPFLEAAFQRGDDIRLVSDNSIGAPTRTGTYLKELEEIENRLMNQYNYQFNPTTKTYEK